MAVVLRHHTVVAPSRPDSAAATNSSQGDEFASPSVEVFSLAFSLREKVRLVLIRPQGHLRYWPYPWGVPNKHDKALDCYLHCGEQGGGGSKLLSAALLNCLEEPVRLWPQVASRVRL